jgi:prophage antirepressor-like protein
MSSAEIIPFTFEEVDVRAGFSNGEAWWVAADIASALGLANPRNMVARLDDDEKGVRLMDTPGGRQSVTVINEAGLYAAIIRSDSPRAAAFKRWITHEVLPEIRRTGSYNAPADDLALPQTYLEALEALVQRERTNLALEQENAQLTPRATAWDAIASAEGDYSVGEAAKMLARAGVQGMGPTRLFQRLAEIRWTYRAADRSWAPYADRVEKGYLALKPQFHYHPGTGEKVIDSPQLRVTVKGIERLRQRLGGTQPALRAVNA